MTVKKSSKDEQSVSQSTQTRTGASRGRKPKYIHTLVLQGINARELYKLYRAHKDSDQPMAAGNESEIGTIPAAQPIVEWNNTPTPMPVTTQLTELAAPKRRNPTTLEPQAALTGMVTMLDYVNYSCMPERTDLSCFHCRHPFNTSPIGLPVQYVKKTPDKQQSGSVMVGTNDYYLTVGVFCSFPCCQAFITEHASDNRFRNSKSLLYAMYYRLYGEELAVSDAPSWETLKEYGGSLSIEEFRQSYCNTTFIITPNIKRPYMVPVGRFVEQVRGMQL
jgi:hypothetical protein